MKNRECKVGKETQVYQHKGIKIKSLQAIQKCVILKTIIQVFKMICWHNFYLRTLILGKIIKGKILKEKGSLFELKGSENEKGDYFLNWFNI